MEDIIIRPLDPEPHAAKGMSAVDHANEALIESNDDRELAGSVVADLNRIIGAIEREFDGSGDNPGPVALAHAAWKSGVALREKALKGFKEAKAIWLQKVRRFEFDVEQKRIAEARRLETEARKKAEQERENQIKEAKRLGDREAVQNLKEAPITVQAQAPKTPEVTKADGLRRSSPIWKWELVNLDKVPSHLKIVDSKGVDAIVRRLGPRAGIPGINVFDARSREEVG